MDNPVVEAIVVSLGVGVAFALWLLWPTLMPPKAKIVKPSEDETSPERGTSVKFQPTDTPNEATFPSSQTTETERRAEAETWKGPTDKVVIDREKFDKLLAQAREHGMARAFGLLQGAGYLETVVREKRLTEAKDFVFGGLSGRQMSERINPEIRAAEAEAAARRPEPPQELRTVTVNGERQIVL